VGYLLAGRSVNLHDRFDHLLEEHRNVIHLKPVVLNPELFDVRSLRVNTARGVLTFKL
jgi:hypothetical protein